MRILVNDQRCVFITDPIAATRQSQGRVLPPARANDLKQQRLLSGSIHPKGICMPISTLLAAQTRILGLDLFVRIAHK